MADPLIEMTSEIYDAFNRRDFEAVVSYMDPELEVHDRDRTGLVHHGPEGWQAFIDEWMENWESYTVEVKEIERSGDNVFIQLVQHGIGKGSGIEFSEEFSQVLTFSGDKVTRFSIFVERDDAMKAAGLA